MAKRNKLEKVDKTPQRKLKIEHQDHTKTRWWTQMLHKSKQFLLHWRRPSLALYFQHSQLITMNTSKSMFRICRNKQECVNIEHRQTRSLLSNTTTFNLMYVECIWRKLFQKRVVGTKLDIYIFIVDCISSHWYMWAAYNHLLDAD